MKLGRGVLAAVRGVAGLALIATASAGCATTPSAEVAPAPAPIAPPRQVEPESTETQSTETQPTQAQSEPTHDSDYAAACGRG